MLFAPIAAAQDGSYGVSGQSCAHRHHGWLIGTLTSILKIV
jgi:hypothetical protein